RPAAAGGAVPAAGGAETTAQPRGPVRLAALSAAGGQVGRGRDVPETAGGVRRGAGPAGRIDAGNRPPPGRWRPALSRPGNLPEGRGGRRGAALVAQRPGGAARSPGHPSPAGPDVPASGPEGTGRSTPTNSGTATRVYPLRGTADESKMKYAGRIRKEAFDTD